MRWKNRTPDMLIEKMISIAGTAQCAVPAMLCLNYVDLKAVIYRKPPQNIIVLTQKRHAPFLIRIDRAPSTRTSDARPYELWIFAVRSFREWKHKDYFQYHRSRYRNNDNVKCSNDRETAHEFRKDNCQYHRSGCCKSDTRQSKRELTLRQEPVEIPQ